MGGGSICVRDYFHTQPTGLFPTAFCNFRLFHPLTLDHSVLEALATLDSHRGQGIGTALVKWGNAYADARGLPSFLLASPQGRTVYEKVGYAEKDVSNLTDEKPFSLPMVRPGKEPN